MATEGRSLADALAGIDWRPGVVADFLTQLAAKPYRFQFCEALRRIDARSGLPRLGKAKSPSQEPVRLRQKVDLTFAPSNVARFIRRTGRADELYAYFMGLLGPNGPMPLHLTEYAVDREAAGDVGVVRFLDIFNHRMMSLFYRAWSESRPTVQFDRPQEDRFQFYVGSLMGIGFASQRDRDTVPDLAKLHFAGLYTVRSRTAGGLERILAGFFEVGARIEPFAGEWVELEEKHRFALGSYAAQLGQFGVLGSRVWQCHQRFRVVFGPCCLGDYRRLLEPERQRRLIDLIQSYLGLELAWEVQLVLKRDDVPALCLGGANQLGRTTWLRTRTPEKDKKDLVFTPRAVA